MARRPKLTEAALAKLGAKRLAALLLAEAAKNRDLKPALQIELAGERGNEAQALRLAFFAKALSRDHLEAYLERLPDFEHTEAEERSLDRVADDPKFYEALWFLVHWPALSRAARLVEERPDRLDGDLYAMLNPAAEALEAHHPLAAALIRRALVTFTLEHARSTRYGHAVRHIRELQSLDTLIDDYGPHETHEMFVDRLKREHARKHGFWSRLEER